MLNGIKYQPTYVGNVMIKALQILQALYVLMLLDLLIFNNQPAKYFHNFNRLKPYRMKTIPRLALIILLLAVSQVIDAQKILLLQHPGKAKRFFYKTGDKIFMRVGEPAYALNGEITAIGDSTVTVDKNFTVPFSKVHKVSRPRWFLRGSWPKLAIASAAYSLISIINRGSNNEKPLIDNTIPIVSGSLLGLAAVCFKFQWRTMQLPGEWRFKVLDYDAFKEK